MFMDRCYFLPRCFLFFLPLILLRVLNTGSDQGFHNYLYYSSKLHQADTISQIVVFEQGRGRVNNLGAMRIRPFSEWPGLYNGTHIFQWPSVVSDAKQQSLSPVVHQWDRDDKLHKFIKQKQRMWQQQWIAKQQKVA